MMNKIFERERIGLSYQIVSAVGLPMLLKMNIVLNTVPLKPEAYNKIDNQRKTKL